MYLEVGLLADPFSIRMGMSGWATELCVDTLLGDVNSAQNVLSIQPVTMVPENAERLLNMC